MTMIMLADSYDTTIKTVENEQINSLDRNVATTESSALIKLISHIQNEIEKLKQQETPSDYQDGLLNQENNVLSRVNMLLILNYSWRKLFKKLI